MRHYNLPNATLGRRREQTEQLRIADVGFVGSKAEVGLPDWRVGLALKNGHAATATTCRVCADIVAKVFLG